MTVVVDHNAVLRHPARTALGVVFYAMLVWGYWDSQAHCRVLGRIPGSQRKSTTGPPCSSPMKWTPDLGYLDLDRVSRPEVLPDQQFGGVRSEEAGGGGEKDSHSKHPGAVATRAPVMKSATLKGFAFVRAAMSPLYISGRQWMEDDFQDIHWSRRSAEDTR